MNEKYQLIPLGNICNYLNGKIATRHLDITTYISTENILSEKGGVTVSTRLPEAPYSSRFVKKDILISNIRPYFKKIWFATHNGGCSNDVLVIRAKDNYLPKFLYYVLADNKFFNYATASAKGTKMPRGDKGAIMNYMVPDIPLPTQRAIAATLSCLDDKIALNSRINHNLSVYRIKCRRQTAPRTSALAARHRGWRRGHGIPCSFEISA